MKQPDLGGSIMKLPPECLPCSSAQGTPCRGFVDPSFILDSLSFELSHVDHDGGSCHARVRQGMSLTEAWFAGSLLI